MSDLIAKDQAVSRADKDAAQRPPLPGTQPKGVRDEKEASQRVREMFSRIAPRYDFLNHLLSFSLDRLWRRRTARRFLHILRRPGARILDLCCGTGDLTLALERARRRSLREPQASAESVLGSDFARPMLERAAGKAASVGSGAKFLAADALALPFADASFDLVTAAFGFRNLANYKQGLGEISRVLRPGGEIGILEFSEPRRWPLAPLYRFYFRAILPRVGGAISGSADAYSYLPASVGKFPLPDELAGWMADVRFADVRYELWTGGIVALHSGRRA
jgi:demethylmenaquinone methyltransferase/2-methoxy-6-polyprenyl-1,4-benzoquinol methylase